MSVWNFFQALESGEILYPWEIGVEIKFIFLYYLIKLLYKQGDLFGGLNDGLLSRAEALAAVDISKHQSGPQPGPPLPQLKHDMVYHHGVGGPPPHNARPHQVLLKYNGPRFNSTQRVLVVNGSHL